MNNFYTPDLELKVVKHTPTGPGATRDILTAIDDDAHDPSWMHGNQVEEFLRESDGNMVFVHEVKDGYQYLEPKKLDRVIFIMNRDGRFWTGEVADGPFESDEAVGVSIGRYYE